MKISDITKNLTIGKGIGIAAVGALALAWSIGIRPVPDITNDGMPEIARIYENNGCGIVELYDLKSRKMLLMGDYIGVAGQFSYNGYQITMQQNKPSLLQEVRFIAGAEQNPFQEYAGVPGVATIHGYPGGMGYGLEVTYQFDPEKGKFTWPNVLPKGFAGPKGHTQESLEEKCRAR